MAEKSLETLMKERAATDRAIAAKHLVAVVAVGERLAQADVSQLVADLKEIGSGLNPSSQQYVGDLIRAIDGGPDLIRQQVEQLTAASAEPGTSATGL